MVYFILLFRQVVEFNEPTGWIVIPLKDLNEKLVRTFMLQIAVLQNHQQVRDWGVRGGRNHRINQCFVSGSGFNQVSESGSGSSRAKMNAMVCSSGCFLLRAEGFSCSLDVLYGGLGGKNIDFLAVNF